MQNTGIHGNARGLPYLDWQIAKHTSSAFDGGTGSAHGDKDAANTYTIWTVTGDIIINRLWGVCNTDLVGASTLEVGVAGNINGAIAQTTATDINDGTIWLDNTPGIGIYYTAVTQLIMFINDGADIVETTGAAADITAGQIDYYCMWSPAEPGASLVGAGTLSQV